MNVIETHLHSAYRIAQQSRDSSSQNGATLVSESGNVIGHGVNNFALGVKYTSERGENRPDKYRYFEHAERASIYQAARVGSRTMGSTMYCAWAACSDCARGIINAGVRTLVMHTSRMKMTPERWREDVNEALAMMQEAGVTLIYYNEPIYDSVSILVNGELWNPKDPSVVDSGNWLVGMDGELIDV